MDIFFDRTLASQYHSHAQIARVLTEDWFERNMYCPHCGNPKLVHCKNNLPVQDFVCSFCGNEYELKSKSGRLGNKVEVGTMSYCSDVRIVLSKKDFLSLSAIIVKQNFDRGKKNLIANLDFEKSNEKIVVFGWNSIKWYVGDDKFGDVNIIMNFIEHHNSIYIRIGENFGDIERKEYQDDNQAMNPFDESLYDVINVVHTFEYNLNGDWIKMD